MDDDLADTQPGAIGSARADAPTQQLGLATTGDRCVACGAPLAGDQRYCVNCGERRSKPRFALPETAPAAQVVTTTSRRPPRRPRAPAGGTMVAGVGTLLLAMGVGVLIGRTNHPAPAPAPAKTQVVYLGGSNGSSGSSTASTATGKKSKSGSKSKAKSHSAPRPSKAAAAKASAAASKVLGSKNLPPATVTVGQSGKGPGFTKGHFTGTFFGGG